MFLVRRRFVDHLIHGNDTEGFCEQCEDVLTILKEDPEGTLESALNACKETNYFTSRICDAEYRIYAGNCDLNASIIVKNMNRGLLHKK